MDLMINGAIMVGALGAITGIIIAIASSVLYVEEDTRVDEIYELLPHFNCGACGTPGCRPMAETLVASEISIQKCRPAKPEQRDAINAKLKELGIEIKEA